MLDRVSLPFFSLRYLNQIHIPSYRSGVVEVTFKVSSSRASEPAARSPALVFSSYPFVWSSLKKLRFKKEIFEAILSSGFFDLHLL